MVVSSVVTDELCPACNSSSLQNLYSEPISGKYRVLECKQCDFAFAAPRPTPKELAELYGDNYHESEIEGLGYPDYRALAEPNMRRMWHDTRKLPWYRQLPNKNVLDVGCATGAYLDEAKRDGFITTGIEVSGKAADIAEQEFGITIVRRELDDCGLPEGSFGLITLFHIFEHFLEPAAAAKKVMDLLAPGGYVFIEVPNWDSVGRFVRGPKWAPLKPPEHLNFFNHQSLQRLLESAGFSDVQWHTIYPLITDRAEVAGGKQWMYKAAVPLTRALCAFGYGGLLRVSARK